MFPTLKNNASAGYKGPVKLELLKAAGLPRIPGRADVNSQLALHLVVMLLYCSAVH